MPKKDLNQLAYSIVRQATGEEPKQAESARAMVGRTGGLKGGAARAAKLTPEQRAEIAKKAAAARWKKP
ncbi:MAG: histone H1 [Ramlibacter sp.]|nr:histone H1 [Ramlibacter sp.]